MRVFDEYVEPAARKLERMIRKQETYKAFSFRASTANAVITSAPLYEVLGAARAAVSRLVEPELTEEGDQEPKIRSEMRKAHYILHSFGDRNPIGIQMQKRKRKRMLYWMVLIHNMIASSRKTA